MDYDEALKLLRGGPEGVTEWNRRLAAGEAIPDLRGADLHRADLPRAKLRDADLSRADLRYANLSGANLSGANLSGADLRYADLDAVDLSKTDLAEADLVGADLRGAYFVEANLLASDISRSNLSGANLTKSNLSGVKFHCVILTRTNLAEAICNATVFTDVDLSVAKGLDAVQHAAPSHLSTDTLIRSRGQIPEAFLRGCGVPDALIAYLPSILGSMQPIQFYSCFISYSSQDTPFAERLHADLQARGVRCWYAPHDLKIGDRFRDRIDESIRVHEKLLLVLSGNSVGSRWVEKEVETAFEQEERQKRLILFPIRLDDAVTGIEVGWPADVRRTRHIGDFTRWKDHDAYQVAFQRLLRDLQAEKSVGKLAES